MQENYKGYIVRVEVDEYPINPRENDNLGIMVCWHKRYNLGDEVTLPFNPDELGGWDEVKAELEKIGAIAITPIYMLDHSGVLLRTTDFMDRWDSGQVGFIYTTKDQIEKIMGKTGELTEQDIKEYETILKAEVQEYSHYISGETYMVLIEQEKECETCHHVEVEMIDSCSGFFTEEEAMQSGKETVDNYGSL